MAGIICNSECEVALLGSIILDEKLIVRAIESGVKPSDFYGEGYGLLYQAMIALHKSKKPIDIVSISSELSKMGADTDVSALATFTRSAMPANIQYYIDEVKDKSYKRDIQGKLLDILGDIEIETPENIKSSIESLSKNIEYGKSVEALFVDASEIKRTDLTSGLETGFSDLDNILGGLVYGSLTVLTGEPSSGKSTLLNQIIAQNIMNSQRCMLYSGELTSFNILQWFMRTVANIDDLKEFKGRIGSYYDVTSHGEDLIRKWIKNRLYIYSEDVSSTIDNLLNSIEYLVRTKDVKLFILDNMMTVDNSGLEEYEKQRKLAKRLKELARKYKICIILVAHPKKKQDNKDNKIYHMHDVAGASEVVNLADYELILMRTIKKDPKTEVVSDITKLGILKNRITGKQGIDTRLYFDSMRKRFWMNKEELVKDYKYGKVDQVKFVELDSVADDVPF